MDKNKSLEALQFFATGLTEGALVHKLQGQIFKSEGIRFIEAKGHTYGNSIVIVEDGDLFYLMHGDVTYSDAALKANKLSTVFEDKEAARETLDRVREFVASHPTVYLSTHCPEGYENLELKRVMKL